MTTTADEALVERSTLEGLFTTATRIRLADEAISRGLNAGRFGFAFYSVRGMEAMSSGWAQCVTADDYLVATYRNLADAIAKGVPLGPLFAEALGKATGTSNGKGGALHIAAPDLGLMATTGIVGGGVPIAVGCALAAQLDGSGQVAIGVMGDGASSTGAWHEAMNLAGLWQLPVVFVCHNNGWAEHTAFEDYTRTGRLSDRAGVYGVTGVTIDGTDILAAYSAARAAVDRARAGDGPTFIESVTYRNTGHSFGAETSYMDQERLEQAIADDPIARFRSTLVSDHGFDDDQLGAIHMRVESEVEGTLTAALDDPDADPRELYEQVYATTEGMPR